MTRPSDHHREREPRPPRRDDRRARAKPISPGIEAAPATERTRLCARSKLVPRRNEPNFVRSVEAGPAPERTQFRVPLTPSPWSLGRHGLCGLQVAGNDDHKGYEKEGPWRASSTSPGIEANPSSERTRFRARLKPIPRRNEPDFAAPDEADPASERTRLGAGSKPIPRRNEPNFAVRRRPDDGLPGPLFATTPRSTRSRNEWNHRSFPGGRAG